MLLKIEIRGQKLEHEKTSYKASITMIIVIMVIIIANV